MNYCTYKYFRIVLLLGTTGLSTLSCDSKAQPGNRNDETIQFADVNYLKEVADQAYQNKEFDKAKSFYSKLISLDSLSGEYYYRRGVSYAHFYDFEKAIEDYSRSVELSYRVHDSYYNMGIIYYIMFMNDSKAIDCFKKALEADPNSKDAAEMLESIYQKVN
ncbi:tetratricopeptide repeat protein [uncultured Pontibacter sp.]|uniref:tetratricopeptide repeat protein n=1 Tax=uncultured Pontibacter sp. TaxID=453356 RepID=UPI00262DEF1E|nr:tetratricopeptide repeat protein [uncultured Pontibacter sp.]